jgi:hypothetical protein
VRSVFTELSLNDGFVIHKSCRSKDFCKIPCLRIISFDFSFARLCQVFPEIINTSLYLFFAKDVIEDDNPILLVKILDGLGVKAVDIEGFGVALGI